mmetsp:Transcript_31005/g.72045  ORF Transcript_31005/g.72045 Transcript_31005/m.72045 type:complete len:186 (-) Transcript_31005:113-670(-)
MLCHDFDMVNFLSGGQVPREVYAIGHCYDEAISALGDLDTVLVTLKFSSGLLAVIDCSRSASYGYDQRVEVFGNQGMAAAHNERRHTVTISNSSGFHSAACQWSFPERYSAAYAATLSHFAHLVRAGEPESAAATRRHMDIEAIVSAAELSWRLNSPVKLDSLNGEMRAKLAALRSESVQRSQCT